MSLRNTPPDANGVVGLVQEPFSFQPNGIGAPTLTKDEQAMVASILSIAAVIAAGGAVTFAAVKAALAAASSSVGFNNQQVNGLANGSTASAAATVGQTYYLPYAAPAGPGTVVPSIVGQNYLMGGTVAAPAPYEPIMHLWPRDTARAPFTLSLGTALSFTTYDPTLQFGYNADLTTPAEPSVFTAFEGDYEYGAGQTQVETYTQVGLGGTLLATGGRPFFTVMNRTNADIATSMDFGNAASSTGAEFWAVISKFSGNALTVTNAHIYNRSPEFAVFLKDSVTNAFYLALGYTGAGGINIYDQPTYGGARRFTTGNAKPTITGNITGAATVNDLKPILLSIIAALKPSALDLVLDTTT